MIWFLLYCAFSGQATQQNLCTESSVQTFCDTQDFRILDLVALKEKLTEVLDACEHLLDKAATKNDAKLLCASLLDIAMCIEACYKRIDFIGTKQKTIFVAEYGTFSTLIHKYLDNVCKNECSLITQELKDYIRKHVESVNIDCANNNLACGAVKNLIHKAVYLQNQIRKLQNVEPVLYQPISEAMRSVELKQTRKRKALCITNTPDC